MLVSPLAVRVPRPGLALKLTVAVELTDFSVYYSQGLADAIAADLKAGKSEVVCEAGKLSTARGECTIPTWRIGDGGTDVVRSIPTSIRSRSSNCGGQMAPQFHEVSDVKRVDPLGSTLRRTLKM
jgi:hypothetical protein